MLLNTTAKFVTLLLGFLLYTSVNSMGFEQYSPCLGVDSRVNKETRPSFDLNQAYNFQQNHLFGTSYKPSVV